MEKEIAFIGNWPELRRVYFRMRGFVIQKIIDRSRISEIDTSYLVGKITYNSVWSHDNAMFVYAFLKKFQNELNQNDVKLLDFSTYMSSTASDQDRMGTLQRIYRPNNSLDDQMNRKCYFLNWKPWSSCKY